VSDAEIDAQIDYGKLLQRALRSVVRQVLEQTAREGLPGEHHFYLSLRTDHAGTRLPPFLRQRFPEEITVVLQHDFRDLTVDDDGFAVTLRFDGIPARLEVRWDAVVAFFDPSVEFGLRFDLPLGGKAGSPALAAVPAPQPAPAAALAPAPDPATEEAPAEAKVLSFGRPRERRDDE
jgi:uncharacterized protein